MSRTKKYLESIFYFSILWGIKEFVIVPVVERIQNKRKTKEITDDRKD